jgi:ribosome-associated translation inhibitor RaiA
MRACSDQKHKGIHMELSIRTRDVELTDALRDQITRRLEFAFDTFSPSTRLKITLRTRSCM